LVKATFTDGRRRWTNVSVAWTPRPGETVFLGVERFEVSGVRGNEVRLRKAGA
jgi:hypothetical protein